MKRNMQSRSGYQSGYKYGNPGSTMFSTNAYNSSQVDNRRFMNQIQYEQGQLLQKRHSVEWIYSNLK